MENVPNKQTNKLQRVIKNRVIRIFLIVMFFVLALFVIQYRNDLLLRKDIVFHSWKSYHKIFDLKRVRVDDNIKKIELVYEYEGNFKKENFEVIGQTYENVVELVFENEESRYYDYKVAFSFENPALGRFFEINDVTLNQNQIAIRNEIGVNIGQVAEQFPEIIYYECTSLSYDSIEEVRAFESIQMIYSQMGYSYTEEQYLRQCYPDCKLTQSRSVY